jgi:hypothetical protein
MGPVDWLLRVWSPGTGGKLGYGRSGDPRQGIYPDFFVTALEPRRVLNAAPVISPQSFTVNEDAQAGDMVGTVEASDPDPGDEITFAITAGNQGNTFAIHPDTGTITVANPAPLANQSTYELTVRVTDGEGLFGEAVMTIDVVPPPIPPVINNQFFIVAAGSLTGTTIGEVAVEEPGGGNLEFSIIAGNDEGAFAINSTTGVLSVADGKLLGTPGTRNLTVHVEDSNGETDSASIEVRVNGAPTSITLSQDEVPENASGAVVGTITVTDPNADDTFTFELDDDRFEIVGDELKLKEGIDLNFEEGSLVPLNITVFDEAGASLTELFEITVLDRNDPPTDITLVAQPVPENSPGAIVGLVTVTDEDDPASSFGTHEFLVMEQDGTESERFLVDGSFQLRLFDGEFLNFEQEEEVVLRIRATDNPDEVGGEPRLSVERTFTITVLDVNDPPVAFDKTFTTPENALLMGNVLIGSEADEKDFDEDGDPLTVVTINGAALIEGQEIVLTSGATLVVGVSGDFTYDASTSEFFRSLLPGAEASDSFMYTITDGQGEFATATVNITVIGINNPPTFEFSIEVQALAQQMVEDQELPLPGVLFDSFDDDETDAEDATYRVLEASFGVSVQFTEDGGLTIIPLANYNGPAWVVVEAEDVGGGNNPPLTASATLTIWIDPVNDPPTAETETFSTLEFTLAEAFKDPLTGNVLANDFDIDADPILNQGLLALPGVTVDNLEELFGLDRTSVELVTPALPNGDGSVTLADGGILFLYPHGDFSYVPEQSYFGIETFEYLVRDIQGVAAIGTVHLRVEPVNDPPSFDPIESPIELNPLIPSVVLITNAVPGPPNEIATNEFFPGDANQELDFEVVSSSNPSFLPGSSVQFMQLNATTWAMVFPVLPFRNEVVELTIRAVDKVEGNANFVSQFAEQTVQVAVIVGQVPASSRQFERRESVSFPAAETLEIIPTTPVTPVVTVTPLQEVGASTQSAAQSERQVVVYLVSLDPTGQLQEEAKLTLSPDRLNDLNSIFRSLPDDRFRIYLHLEDNSRRLVVDVYVRDGKPYNPGDLEDEIIFPEVMEEIETLPQETEPEAPRDESALSLPEISVRWGLIAGSVALLGTRKQWRDATKRALADCADRPFQRFSLHWNDDDR